MDMINSIHSLHSGGEYTTNVTHTTQTKNVNENNNSQVQQMSQDELKKRLKEITEEVNDAIKPLNQDLKFHFDDKSNELVVKVVDTKTDKVIKQFPPQEALNLMQKVKEVVGLLFDERG
jgi:flagellar protein FlaG